MGGLWQKLGASGGEERLAGSLFAVVLIGFCVKALLMQPTIAMAACQALIVAVQLSALPRGRHLGKLAAMVVLTYAPLPWFGPVWLGVAGFLAGPVLLVFPWWFSWPAVAAIMASVAALGVAYGLDPAVWLNLTVSTLVSGLVMYALLRLARIVGELRTARESLARSAIVEERLRAARDLHDLLGHSLAAILLRCELARRINQPEALEEIITMAEHAQQDLREVSGESSPRELSLTREAEQARATLAMAGVDVTLALEHPALPGEAETVLSTVLREAVTNVLRHSAARNCTIETSATEGLVRLSVSNDGVRAGEVRRGSAGIGNLTTRLATLDGRLTARLDAPWFHLDATAPYT